MTLQLHESAINNLAFDVLAGRTVYEDKVQAAVKNALGHLPDKLKGDEDGKPWAITFAARQPSRSLSPTTASRSSLTASSFTRGTTTATHHGLGGLQDREYAGGIQGDSAGPGRGHSGQRGGQHRRNAGDHSRVAEEAFREDSRSRVLGKGIELSGRWKRAGKLMPIQVECRDGWLVLAWKRAPAGPKVPQRRPPQRRSPWRRSL